MQARVFLVGCSRSGTTVVQRCLNAHPAMTSFPETDFFGRLVGGWNGRLQARFGRVRKSRRQAAFQRLAEVLERPEIERHGDAGTGFREAVDVLVETLDGIARERGASVWVEKTPKHFRYVRLMERSIANVRFIHLVRDGRDVVASLVDRARRHPEFGNRVNPRAAARLWNEAIRAALRCRGREGHLLLSYEDFVHDPERELRNVCDFLHLGYDEAMPAAQDVSTIVTADEAWKSGSGEPIIQRDSKFHELLTGEEQQIVQRALDWRGYHALFPRSVGVEREQ